MAFPIFGRPVNTVVTEQTIWMEINYDFFEVAFALVVAWGFFILLELDLIRRKITPENHDDDMLAIGEEELHPQKKRQTTEQWIANMFGVTDHHSTPTTPTTTNGLRSTHGAQAALHQYADDSLNFPTSKDYPSPRRDSPPDPNKMKPKPWKKTSHLFRPRYTGPKEGELTEDQIEIRDAILASRKRTGLRGPFGPWLAVPAIAGPAQTLGRACRYGTSLSFKESELVILLTGAKTKAHAEFDIHVPEAIKAGWTMTMINAVPRDDEFSVAAVKQHLLPLMENDRERAICTFTTEMLDTFHVSDETYESTKRAMGGKDSVLVEITSIAGYYTYASYTLNVFRIAS
mmetsp:Transcript_9257/g.13536  ORF Transcript_9257/g.13536 Transcript_9257/m.13536 type:complete len:345 (-) Transcript_9257:304-1338(-)